MTDIPNATAPDPNDMTGNTWVERSLPRALVPYAHLMRLDRPIGTWLLLFPGLWSIAMALTGASDLRYFAWFAVGALIMRGAGCVWNDITDRDFDAAVARTRTRPIASGAVKVWQAGLFLACLLAIGLAVLLQFNQFAVILGAASLVIVFAYPLMKRITHWPQLVLGLAFNWGALLGWAAVRGDLDSWAPFCLYAAGILWTLGYDTIYAHQDKEDDALIGVKSTALLFGDQTRPFLFLFYGGTIVFMLLAGQAMGFGWQYYVVYALGAAHLIWQAATVKFDDPADCLSKFKSNRVYGWLVLGAVAFGHQAMAF